MNVRFGEMFHKKYFGKTVTVRAIISGKSISAPYSIPKTIKIKCKRERDEKCKGENCVMAQSDTYDIELVDMLRFIDVSDAALFTIIKKILNIRCSFSYKILKVQNVERLFISAPTGKERNINTSSYGCYYLGYGIDVNTVYELTGVVTNEPSTQVTTCLFTDAKRLNTDIETFNITKDIKNKLKKFAVGYGNVESIYNYLERLYDSYAKNITKIHDRFHLHVAIDMVFHSALSFYFDKELVHKGWLDAAVIGDTRCGKGYVAERLAKYYNVGDVVSGDNASYSGLIVGLQKFGEHWTTSWGKVPMNDKGLVIIDEAGELNPTDWTRLTRVRSEGVAEIVKINKQIANARTRLLFLMNPPFKTISSYSYGIQSLMDVVKSPEDVARFDYVHVVAHNDVSIDDINKPHGEVSPYYTQEEEEMLIMWIWSRKINQIKFTADAVAHVYKCAKRMAKRYAFVVPLVQGENIRIKIAKLAVCLAGRLYSHSGHDLVVDKIHVECAHMFFNVLYSQDANGYDALSKMQKEMEISIDSEDMQVMIKFFSTFKDNRQLLKVLHEMNDFVPRDLMEALNLPVEFINELLSKMITHHLIIKAKNGKYVRNSAFTAWLRKKIFSEEGK